MPGTALGIGERQGERRGRKAGRGAWLPKVPARESPQTGRPHVGVVRTDRETEQVHYWEQEEIDGALCS